jgi:hypothetical protein
MGEAPRRGEGGHMRWRAGTPIYRIACLVLLAGACASTVYPQVKPLGSEPAAHTAPPADPTTLIKTVAENQKQIEAARKDYIFHRQDEEQEFDSQGHVKSTEIKEYEVYFIGAWEIERLLSKNGKPLTEGERKKQDEEVRKQEAKARARMAKHESGEDPGKNTITLAKFLAADRFYNLHRVTYQGREVYAMDFAPRPDFRPHSLVDKVLKTLGGTLWIDEQAKQGVPVEARFLEGVKVGGGLLASVQKGGNVVLEQRFVNDEVWMPSYLEIHLDAHVLFLHKSIHGTSTYSDYRKFRVDSKITGGAEEQ